MNPAEKELVDRWARLIKQLRKKEQEYSILRSENRQDLLNQVTELKQEIELLEEKIKRLKQ